VGSGNAIATGQQQANAVQTGQIAADRADQRPFIATGTNALQRVGDLSGANGMDAATAAMTGFTASPGYQYARDQGLQAIDQGAASRGLLRSGDTVRAEQTFGTDLANRGFADYYGRLNALAGLGQSAASNVADSTGRQTSGIAGTNTSAGAANSSLYGTAANTVGNALTKLSTNPSFLSSISPYQPAGQANSGGYGGIKDPVDPAWTTGSSNW